MTLAVGNITRKPLVESIEYHLQYTVAKSRETATKGDVLHALAHSVRAILIDGLSDNEKRRQPTGAIRLVFLWVEFPIGQSLRKIFFNVCLLKEAELAT